MRNSRQKLNSQTGASISFALLLFLVCAVVGSVVLVAGTSAAGRVSRLPEMDQRYYSVTSAAGLLCDTLSGETVTLTKITTTTTRLNENGVEIIDPNNPQVSPTESVSPSDANALLLEAAQWLQENPSSDTPYKRTLTMTATNPDFPSVTVEETLSSDGTLKMDVYNTDTSQGTYKVRLTFKADIHTLTDDKTTVGTPEQVVASGTDVTYVVKQIKKTTVTTDVTWQVTDIETVNEALQ